MSAYYEDAAVTLYHGDCREILPTVTADVALTDPPYSVNKGGDMLGFLSPNWSQKATHSRGYADHDTEAFRTLMEESWEAIAGTLAKGGIAVAFCGDRTMHEMVTAAGVVGWQALHYLPFVSQPMVAKSTTTLRPAHELAVLMRTKGPVRHINPDWTKSTVYTLDKPRKAESEHMTTKPLAWMHALVDHYSKPGDVILDPFAGSGTTGRAAKDLGRKAVLIEKDEAYCEIAAKRLSQEVFDFDGLEIA